MMDIAEGVYTTFAQKYLGTYELEWMGEKIDLTPGWPRHDHGGGREEVCGH